MKATIFPYRKEHEEELIALFTLNSPTYFAPEELIDFKNYLKTQREDYFILKVDEQLIGCGGINYEQEGTIGIISWDILAPAYHGKGYGTTLLQYRIARLLKHKNVTKVIVRTSQLTYLFYEKNGFKVESIKKDYWAKGFDLYLMTYQSMT